ncbi:MAG TPA: hypothetical protein VJ783_02965 [Pirellulales bacterium]|nr:hypothetical protein [Pirellulales bacterium]
MNHQEDLSPDLLAAVDACRPDSDDMQLPEVAAALAGHPRQSVDRLRGYVERRDRAIAAATQRTPVPEGLAERILANLAHQAPAGTCPADVRQPADRAGRPRPTIAARPWRRRNFKIALGSAAVAAVVGLVAFALRPNREPIDAAAVEQFAREIHTTDNADAELLTTAAPPQFPVDARLARAHIRGWREMARGFLDLPAIAYTLTNNRGVGATLYVVNPRSRSLASIATTPHSVASTGGLTIGVWQNGGQLYVLVVAGGTREFRSYIPQQQSTA